VRVEVHALAFSGAARTKTGCFMKSKIHEE
jgi:hypothetical protein